MQLPRCLFLAASATLIALIVLSYNNVGNSTMRVGKYSASSFFEGIEGSGGSTGGGSADSKSRHSFVLYTSDTPPIGADALSDASAVPPALSAAIDDRGGSSVFG